MNTERDKIGEEKGVEEGMEEDCEEEEENNLFLEEGNSVDQTFGEDGQVLEGDKKPGEEILRKDRQLKWLRDKLDKGLMERRKIKETVEEMARAVEGITKDLSLGGDPEENNNGSGQRESDEEEDDLVVIDDEEMVDDFVENEVKKVVGRCRKMKEKLVELQKSNGDLEGDVQELETNAGQLEAEIRGFKTETRELKEEMEQLKKAKLELEEKLKKRETQLQDLVKRTLKAQQAKTREKGCSPVSSTTGSEVGAFSGALIPTSGIMNRASTAAAALAELRRRRLSSQSTTLPAVLPSPVLVNNGDSDSDSDIECLGVIIPSATTTPITSSTDNNVPPEVVVPVIKLEPGVPPRLPHRRHTRDVTKRFTKHFYYCTCGIRFASRHKLTLHVGYWTNVLKNCLERNNRRIPLAPEVNPGSSAMPSTASSGNGVPSTNTNKRQPPANYTPNPNQLFACDLCPMRFWALGLLKGHKAAAHNVKDDRFQIGCRTCGQIFFSRSDHSNHFRSVHKKVRDANRPAAIQVIYLDATAENLPQLQCHRKDHTKPAILGSFCVCGTKFTGTGNPQALQEHLNLMKGLRKVTCKTCTKLFGNAKQLHAHVLSVHKILRNGQIDKDKKKVFKPFRCGCGRGFYNLGMLKKHRKSHEYKMIIRCRTCRRKCASPRELEQHMREEHDEQ